MPNEIPCCPSCANEDVDEIKSYAVPIRHWVLCCECGTTGPYRPTAEAAIAAWASLHGPGRPSCEKERRVYWQGLAYAGMSLLDALNGTLVHKGRGTTVDMFVSDVEKAKEVLRQEAPDAP